MTILAASCTAGLGADSTTIATTAATSLPYSPLLSGAFSSESYRNLFAEYLGKTEAETRVKLDSAWKQLFYGDDSFERLYYPVGEDMAYIKDIGNGDVRTEGISYGMMIAVQLDR